MGKFGSAFLWDEFYELARDHATARLFFFCELEADNSEIEREDRRYAAVTLIAAQPFFDPFYGSTCLPFPVGEKTGSGGSPVGLTFA